MKEFYERLEAALDDLGEPRDVYRRQLLDVHEWLMRLCDYCEGMAESRNLPATYYIKELLGIDDKIAMAFFKLYRQQDIQEASK